MRIWGASIGTAMVGSFVLYLAIKGDLGTVLGYMFSSAPTTPQTGAGTVGGAVSGVVTGITGTSGASVKATVQ